MNLSHHTSTTSETDVERDRSGATIGLRLLAAWAVFATTLFGVTPPASSFGMTMEPSIISVVCDGSYGSIGRISGAGASEVISFAATPAAQFLPARSSTAGNYNVIWKCDPSQAGTQWSVTASGASSGRTTSFSVVAEAAPLPPLPAVGTNLLTNGGIETGSAAPWAIIDQSGTTTMTAATSTIAQEGSRALFTSSGTTAGGSVGQDIVGPIEPGQTFTYSVWARHSHAGGTPQAATIVLETVDGPLENAVLAVTVTEVWQRFDVTLSVASNHRGLRTKFVMLTPTSANRGNYVLDNASLVQSSPNPIGLLELVSAGAGSVGVRGYAIDPNQPYDAVPVVVSVGAEQTQLAADVVRTDVAAMYPSAGPVHGFEAQIATAQSGVTQVCVVARNLGAGADTPLGCVSVVIAAVTATSAPTSAAPTTTTSVSSTTPTTATPTTAIPTTATPTTATPTTATPTTSSTALDPLGPQAFEPSSLLSLFSATDLVSMASAYDFEIEDADTLRLYWAFFSREPDIAGAKYWIGMSRTGMTLDEMAYNFAQSVEFRRTYGSVSDHEFLGIVYRNVLGRHYDTTGFNYWLAVIHAGLPRSGAVRWIAANAEFVEAHPYPETEA